MLLEDEAKVVMVEPYAAEPTRGVTSGCHPDSTDYMSQGAPELPRLTSVTAKVQPGEARAAKEGFQTSIQACLRPQKALASLILDQKI